MSLTADGGVMLDKGSKRLGMQMCDYCGRDFEARKGEWDCDYCGYDNRVGVERAKAASREGSRRSAEKRRQARIGNTDEGID